MRPTSILAVVLMAANAAVAQLEPTDLRCEYARTPSTDAAKPRLSWKLQSSERGQRQTAYQILVATTPEKLAAGQGVVEHLHRHATTEADVVGQEDLGGGAHADRCDQPVAPSQHPADLCRHAGIGHSGEGTAHPRPNRGASRHMPPGAAGFSRPGRSR